MAYMVEFPSFVRIQSSFVDIDAVLDYGSDSSYSHKGSSRRQTSLESLGLLCGRPKTTHGT